MSKKKYYDYIRAIGLEPTAQQYAIDGDKKVRTSSIVDDYAFEAHKQNQNSQNEPKVQTEPQQDSQQGTVHKNSSTQPASWESLKSFLTTNIDANRNWDNEQIVDYSFLNDGVASKKLTNDQRAEGMLLFNNYLSEKSAIDAYNKAFSDAENNARRNMANQDVLAKKIMSYLAEAQGNAGLEGYSGVTQGQAINLANMQQSAQQNIQNEKNATQQSALEAYQQALLENSQNYADQYGVLMASRDEKADNEYNNYVAEVQGILENNIGENGLIKTDDFNKALDYVSNLNTTDSVKYRINQYIETYYGNIINNETNQSKSVLASIDSFEDGNTYNDIKAQLDEYKSSLGDEYDTYLDKLNEKMSKWVKENVEVNGLGKSLVSTDDIDVVINGKTFDLLSGKNIGGTGMDNTLNNLATGNKEIYPEIGTLVAYNGNLYIYKQSREGKNWHKIESDHDTVESAYNEYTRYDKDKVAASQSKKSEIDWNKVMQDISKAYAGRQY